MTTAAPTQAAPAPAEGTPEQAPGATGSLTAPTAPRRLKLRGLDGDDERDYDETQVVGWAQRGKKASQILSKAEERAQEAARKEAAAEERFARLKSKDVGSIRATLRELGVDVRALAEVEVKDYLEEKDLTPEQRRIRELEANEGKRRTADEQAKKKADADALEAEQKVHEEELSSLFLEAMKIAKLPRTSAKAAFPRLASLYQTAAASGIELSPEVAAERLRGALKAEQRALFYRESADPRTGQKREELDLDALEEWFTPEDWKAIQRRGVEKFRKNRLAGAQPPPQRAPPAEEQPTAAPKGRNFWRELDKRTK